MADDNDQKRGDEKPNDAASRAGQFLDGPVTQAFCSPEQAGYRCATQTPGCEPTGFTGQCTKQPEVGGAWPCITAMPFCAEPTGFTGQCTQHPWPNPTRYVGCTVLHCPTNDLTHQPQICRVVEQGLQGGAQQPGGQGEAKVEGVGAAQQPTALLGCGYTQTWGMCPTHLLGCGYTQQWGCPPQQQQQQRQPQGFAAAQQPTYPNGDCTFFGCPPQTLIPTQCQSMLQPCITQTETPDCGGQQQVGGWPTLICRTMIFCPPRTIETPCIPRITIRCPEFTPGCPWQITPRITPIEQGPVFRGGGGFGGGGFGGGGFVGAAQQPTYPNGDCTFFGCPPQGGGGGGQTAATVCTQFGHQCQSAVDACPTRLCGGGGGQQFNAAAGIGTWPTPATRCFVCDPMQAAAPTPSAVDACPTRINCPTYPNGDCTFFGCPPQGGGGGGQTAATVCTQFGHQCQSAVDACPTRLCGAGGGQQFNAAAGIGTWPTPATRCFICDPMQANAAMPTPSAVDACPTRIGCPTYPDGDCTFFGCHPYGGGATQEVRTFFPCTRMGCFTVAPRCFRSE